MKRSDFGYRVTFPEFVGKTGNMAFDAEPSLEMLIQKYYRQHFDTEEANELTNRYIKEMITLSAKLQG